MQPHIKTNEVILIIKLTFSGEGFGDGETAYLGAGGGGGRVEGTLVAGIPVRKATLCISTMHHI